MKELESPHSLSEMRPITVSMAAVLMTAPTTLEIVGFVELAGESPMRGDGPGIMLLVFPFLFCFGLPPSLVGTMFGVLPTLSAAVWARRRCGRRRAADRGPGCGYDCPARRR
ncbi:hypothetical protein [Streptomyces sp. NBC_00893]|uniref:hypothetical protein n=1 Tax=Streptomyces sp. NBC_00893 TaxID=2975862 RepID=UPI00224CEB1C|nr:hypothetical protein [Streptomyces sp. NBC_00893]MCX4851221.1 hypothetical protein [Streptomyces sp. NBC_00893]